MKKINFGELPKYYSLREKLDYLISQCHTGDCDYDDGYFDAIVMVKHLLGYQYC